MARKGREINLFYVQFRETLVFLSFILLLCLPQCSSVQNEGYFDEEGGIFESFVRVYLQTLAYGCSEKKLRKYSRSMYYDINALGYKFTRKLAKIFKNSEFLIDEVRFYLKTLDNDESQTIRLKEFFKAMDDIFHIPDKVRFDDYIYNLQDYCKGYKFDMKEESHKIIHDVIMYNINKLNYKREKELRKKLEKAEKEFRRRELKELIETHSLRPLPHLDSSDTSSSDSHWH